MNNAQQILGIVTAAFGVHLFDLDLEPTDCSKSPGDVEELACEWRQIAHTAKSMKAKEEPDPQWVLKTSKVP
jgi:hypothetical protein